MATTETTKKTKSVFETLNAINVNEHVEKKSVGAGRELSYLSWAWAWAEACKHYPDAVYTIYENADGWNYHTDGRTCWVKTGVTINGKENIEYLPVMDSRNRSIAADAVTSFDVNKAIQRSLTKAIARHGLGLYIYAGEDMPDAADDINREQVTAKPRTAKSAAKPKEEPKAVQIDDALYWNLVNAYVDGTPTKSGATMREWFAMAVNNDPQRLKGFDNDVERVRQARG